MNKNTSNLKQAIGLLQRCLRKEQQPEPLNLALSRQLTQILSIVGCRFDRVIQSSIAKHVQCLSDYQSTHSIPRVVFDHPAIGKHITNLLVRQKRNLKLSKDQLALMEIECVQVDEYVSFDPDLFCVEACHPTSDQRYDDTVCEMLSPAFRWKDQHGQRRIKQGSIVAYMYEQCSNEKIVGQNRREKAHV